jgi:hypothetical protein
MMQIAFQAAAAIIALTAAIMAWRLERRLVRLRSGQDAMQKAAAALTEAVARAEASVRALRAEGADTAQELEGLIGRARAASDELRLLNAPPRRVSAPRPAPAPAAGPTNVARLRSAATWDIDADDEPAAAAPRLPEPARPTGADMMERLRRVR